MSSATQLELVAHGKVKTKRQSEIETETNHTSRLGIQQKSNNKNQLTRRVGHLVEYLVDARDAWAGRRQSRSLTLW